MKIPSLVLFTGGLSIPFVLAQVSIPSELVITLGGAIVGGVSSFYVAQMKSDSGDRALEQRIEDQKGILLDRMEKAKDAVYQSLRELDLHYRSEIGDLKTEFALLKQESIRGDLDHGKILDSHEGLLVQLRGNIAECRAVVRQLEYNDELRQGRRGGGSSTNSTM